MNVLVIGSGGREHALCWKIATSSLLDRLFIAPGNAGTALCGENVDVSPSDFEGLADLILKEEVGMVVVGPEEPLVRGIRDYFESRHDLAHLVIVGPDAAGARLEGSKDFAKSFMMKYGIPTARYRSFTGMEAAAYVRSVPGPYVLKADGLAAGKGVVILDDPDEAVAELEAMFGGKFGSAGSTVVIEEFLTGIELSVFILTDGHSYLLLPEAKDYKRIGEGDTGPNTGGMGAVSPVPFADEQFMTRVKERIIEPTLRGCREMGMRYQGFIFFGLINVGGDPYVIEYNVRMGDPESEAVIPRIESDLLGHFMALKERRLDLERLVISPMAATTVMMVSGGYPGDYEKGREIHGLDQSGDALVFHAGTRTEGQRVLTNGGRVLAVTSLHSDWHEALAGSYKTAGRIGFEGVYYRKDIGFDL